MSASLTYHQKTDPSPATFPRPQYAEPKGESPPFHVRIHAMPYLGGQPLSHRLLTCPAPIDAVPGLTGQSLRSRWVLVSRFCTSLGEVQLARGGGLSPDTHLDLGAGVEISRGSHLCLCRRTAGRNLVVHSTFSRISHKGVYERKGVHDQAHILLSFSFTGSCLLVSLSDLSNATNHCLASVSFKVIHKDF